MTAVIAGRPAPGRRDLDEQVRPVDLGPQIVGLVDGGAGVVGQPRVDLDRHPAVESAGSLGHGLRAGRRPPGRRRWSGRGRRCRRPSPARRATRSWSSYALLLVIAAWKIVGLVVTPTTWRSSTSACRLPVDEAFAGQVVEPDGDALVGEPAEPVGGGHRCSWCPPEFGGRSACRRDGLLGGSNHGLRGDPELAEEDLVVSRRPEVLEAD